MNQKREVETRTAQLEVWWWVGGSGGLFEEYVRGGRVRRERRERGRRERERRCIVGRWVLGVVLLIHERMGNCISMRGCFIFGASGGFSAGPSGPRPRLSGSIIANWMAYTTKSLRMRPPA